MFTADKHLSVARGDEVVTSYYEDD